MNLRERMKGDHGLSTLELAFVIPVLLLLMSFVIPLVSAGWSYMTMSRAAAAGIRYATKVETNARTSPVGLTRRPTGEEVEAFVREAAEPVTLESVEVEPSPASSLPGEAVTVTITYQAGFGPVATLANGVVSTFFGGRELLPANRTVTVSARGRQE